MQNPNSETTIPLTTTAPDLTPKNQNFDFMGLAPLVLVFIVFYFMIFRPQQQKIKNHKNLLERLQRGDRILTEGGILATVHRVVNDNELQIELTENVIIRIRRSAVVDILSKPEIQSKEDLTIPSKNKKIPDTQGKSKKK